jgi:hypothetical protein
MDRGATSFDASREHEIRIHRMRDLHIAGIARLSGF